LIVDQVDGNSVAFILLFLTLATAVTNLATAAVVFIAAIAIRTKL
jgi:hypothetical protein